MESQESGPSKATSKVMTKAGYVVDRRNAERVAPSDDKARARGRLDKAIDELSAAVKEFWRQT